MITTQCQCMITANNIVDTSFSFCIMKFFVGWGCYAQPPTWKAMVFCRVFPSLATGLSFLDSQMLVSCQCHMATKAFPGAPMTETSDK